METEQTPTLQMNAEQLHQAANDDYHSPKAIEARERFDRRARDTYRDELRDTE